MREVDPRDTSRALAWSMFKDAPMPMVTIFKTLDITNVVRISKAGKLKLNMLMCYCAVRAASKIPEFYLLPLGDKMYKYDKLGVNLIVANREGGINSCDVPFCEDISRFNDAYLDLTGKVHDRCENYDEKDMMILGTSCLPQFDIDGIVNMYSGVFNNPFLAWAAYREENGKYTLKVSFQFHHVQMDGMQACTFLDTLQETINTL